MQTVAVSLTLCVAYAVVAAAGLAILNRRWQSTDNGLNPRLVAFLWPLVLLFLAAYYLAAGCYTYGAVLRGRRTARQDSGTPGLNNS